MNFDFMDSTVWIMILGVVIGVLLEVIAVFVTAYIFRHSKRSEPVERPPAPVQRPVEPKQESRMSQVGLAPPTRTPEARLGSVSIGRVSQPIVRELQSSVVPVMRVIPALRRPVVQEQPVVREQETREPVAHTPAERDASVARAQAVIQEQLTQPDTEPVPVEPPQRPLSRFIYYVDDREETYPTLLGALQALFPEEAVKYSQIKRPLWTGLPKDIRDTIHREETSRQP